MPFFLYLKGIYYALEEGETLDTPGVRLPSVKDFFTDLVELNGIIHSGERWMCAGRCRLRSPLELGLFVSSVLLACTRPPC